MEWLSEALHELLVPPTPVQQLGRATRSIERDARRLARVREDCDAREKRALAELRKLSRGNATHNQLRAAARDVARVRATRDQVYAAQDKLEGLRSRLVAGGVSTNVQGIMASATEALAAVPAISNPLRARAEMLNYERMQMRLEQHDDIVNSTLDDDGADDTAESVLEQVLAEASASIAQELPEAPFGSPAAERVEVDAVAAGLRRLRGY